MHQKDDRVILRAAIFAWVFQYLSRIYTSQDTILELISIAFLLFSVLSVVSRVRVKNVIFLYLYVVALMMLIQGAYTGLIYSQTILDFFSAVRSYIYILLVFPFSYFVQKYGISETLEKLICPSTLVGIFMLFVAVVYNLTGISLVESLRERQGLARLGEPKFIDLSILYLTWKFRYNFTEKYDLIRLIVLIGSIIYVAQSRAIIISLVVAAIILIITSLKGFEKKYVACIFGVFVLLLMINYGFIGRILDSFSLEGAEAGSTDTRLQEINYYLSAFLQRPFTGLGIIKYGSHAYSIVSGPFNQYYPEDIGIIGALGVIGVWSVLIYVAPLIVFGKCIRNSRIENLKSLHYVLFSYVIATSFSLLMVFPTCDPAWPFLISIFLGQNNPRKIILTGIGGEAQ